MSAIFIRGNELHARNRDGGNVVVLDGTSRERRILEGWAKRARAEVPSGVVAMLGGGLCIVPSLLFDMPYLWDIYELNPEIRDVNPKFSAPTYRWIIGDYVKTFPLPGARYDAIFFDVDEEPKVDLTRALVPGGLLLKWELLHG